MSKTKTYLGLTIGPIVNILMEARKTRELWAASYLLSTLMKHLMDALDPIDPKTEEHPNILIPSIPKEVSQSTLYGAGIYPDRLFMEADGWSKEDVAKAVHKAIEALAADCLTDEDKKKEKVVEQAVEFWKRYLRIRYVLKELSNIKDGKLSLELTPYLESAELEETFLPMEPDWHALYKLFDVDRLYQKSLNLSQSLRSRDNRGLYDPILPKHSFVPSTYEVASMELHAHHSLDLQSIAESMQRDDSSEAFYTKIEADEKLSKFLLPRHKYFCIVRADGDSIGSAIQQLGDKQEYIDFSRLLAVFGKDAAKKINDYGGKPIYIGGDDLLFLAPLQNGEKTVFDLIDTIDGIFPVEKLKTGDANKKASLSYGLNIAYYKYPLFEAINDSFGIMLKAKDYIRRVDKKEKNAISFHFTKHSGSFFDATFSKDYLKAINKATKVFNAAEMQQKQGLVSSLIFKIKTLEELLISLVSKVEEAELGRRFQFFFDKYFEEWKNNGGFDEQKNSAKNLLLGAFKEAGKDGFLDLYFATMRLIDFINEPNQHIIYDTENQPQTVG